MTCSNREQSLSWPSSLWPDPAQAARSRPAGGTASAHRAATCPCPHGQTLQALIAAASRRRGPRPPGISKDRSRVYVRAGQSLVSACTAGLENSPVKLTSKLQSSPFLFPLKNLKSWPFSISPSVSQSARSFLDSGFRYLTVQL